VTTDPRDYDPRKRDAELPEDGKPGRDTSPDTAVRETAREEIRENREWYGDHPPCVECEETGVPVVDGPDVSTANLMGCEACGRKPLNWTRRFKRAIRAAENVEFVVVRRRRR